MCSKHTGEKYRDIQTGSRRAEGWMLTDVGPSRQGMAQDKERPQSLNTDSSSPLLTVWDLSGKPSFPACSQAAVTHTHFSQDHAQLRVRKRNSSLCNRKREFTQCDGPQDFKQLSTASKFVQNIFVFSWNLTQKLENALRTDQHPLLAQ